ncbi:MAG: histone deacetylase, partial [Hymenobacter sp.]
CCIAWVYAAHCLRAQLRPPAAGRPPLPDAQVRAAARAATAGGHGHGSRLFCARTCRPTPDILRVHDARRITSACAWASSPGRRSGPTGFPWSPALFEREITILGGTIECARRALRHGAAFNVAGGTHHAFRDRGEGFCLLNDQAAAAAWLLAQRA